jgi:DNA mismatch repair protein MSH5
MHIRAQNQSSFSGEVNQIAGIVRKSTSRSLVIIDEFGKGTAATDGLGLMAGLLEHLANRKGDCPKILITTHFHELFSNSLLEQKENIDYLKMDAVIDDSLTFLYRCVPGKSLRSLGYFCAAIAGVPDNIVARGKATFH